MWSVWPAASSHSHNESTLALSSDTIQHAPPHKANTKTQTQTQTHKQRHRHIWTPTQTRTHRYRHTCIQQHTHINLVAADYSYIEGSNVLKQFNGFQRKYFPSPILIEMWCRQVSPVKLKIAWPPPPSPVGQYSAPEHPLSSALDTKYSLWAIHFHPTVSTAFVLRLCTI